MELTPEEKNQVNAWFRAGIPSRYLRPKEGLRARAAIEGKEQPLFQRLHTQATNGELRDSIREGKGRTIMSEDEDAFALTARAVLTACERPVIYLDIRELLHGRGHAVYTETIAERKAVFIQGFYVAHYPDAFTDTERLTIELGIRWLISRGCAIFIAPEKPPMECLWWSPSFLKLISKVCPLA